jgi:uncharacterized membrane protein YfcA
LKREALASTGEQALKSEMIAEAQAAAAKLSLPATVIGAKAAGWGPAEWMYALTALYVVLQGAYLIWKWRREWDVRRGNQD